MFAFFPSNLWQPCWIFKMAAVFIWNTAISQLLSIKDTCFLCLNIYFWDINPGIISCHLSWAWDWAQKSKMADSFHLIWAISGPESPPVTTLTILESLEWVETRFWVHLEVPRPQNCHQGKYFSSIGFRRLEKTVLFLSPSRYYFFIRTKWHSSSKQEVPFYHLLFWVL